MHVVTYYGYIYCYYRDLIISLVPKGVTVVEQKAFRRALRRGGLPGPIGPYVSSKRYRRNLIRITKKALKIAKARSVIIGRSRRTRR